LIETLGRVVLLLSFRKGLVLGENEVEFCEGEKLLRRGKIIVLLGGEHH